jgi:hypothetical protein
VKDTIGRWDTIQLLLGDVPETCIQSLQFSSVSTTLALEEVEWIIEGNEVFIPKLKDQMKDTRKTFDQVSQRVSDVLASLGNYYVLLGQQIPKIKEIKNELSTDIDLDEETKDTFQTEINNLNSEISKEYAQIAGIASGMGIGSGIIISTLSIGGLGIFLIPFMLGGDIAGILEIIQLGRQIKSDKAKIDADNQKMSEYTSALSVLQNAETNIEQFYVSIKSISDNIQALSGAWKELSQAAKDIYSQFDASNEYYDNSDWYDLGNDLTLLNSQFLNMEELFKLISILNFEMTRVQLDENMTQDQIQQALANPSTVNLTEFLFTHAA